ncbi:MAG: hypothetical protein GX921_00805 [Bacteroidales bacterium]|nr:hypothetical protein [Bacteroidales bacterium]
MLISRYRVRKNKPTTEPTTEPTAEPTATPTEAPTESPTAKKVDVKKASAKDVKQGNEVKGTK